MKNKIATSNKPSYSSQAIDNEVSCSQEFKDIVEYYPGPLGPMGPIGPIGPIGLTGLRGKTGEPGKLLTPLEILDKLKTVDGSRSGLDADTLDGKEFADFATSDHTHQVSEIDNLNILLNEKSNTDHIHPFINHTHSIDEITYLQNRLDSLVYKDNHLEDTKITKNDYASDIEGGTVKMKIIGSTLYITNDGSNA